MNEFVFAPLIETYREGAVCPSYACLYSSVLSLLQKPVNVRVMSQTVSGNEFQIEGPIDCVELSDRDGQQNGDVTPAYHYSFRSVFWVKPFSLISHTHTHTHTHSLSLSLFLSLSLSLSLCYGHRPFRLTRISSNASDLESCPQHRLYRPVHFVILSGYLFGCLPLLRTPSCSQTIQFSLNDFTNTTRLLRGITSILVSGYGRGELFSVCTVYVLSEPSNDSAFLSDVLPLVCWSIA